MGNPEQTNADATSNEPQASSQSVDYEKRFKDTQAAYTKSQQELKALQAKAKVLEELTQPKVELDEAVANELNELKYSDPDAWRNKMNSLEQTAVKAHQEKLTVAQAEAMKQSELELRASQLNEFAKSNPDLVINDEVMNLDVPLRFSKRLESGEINYQQFLEEVAGYLRTPKVIGDGNKTLEQPNLSKVAGDDTPTKDSVKKDIVKDYKNLVF